MLLKKKNLSFCLPESVYILLSFLRNAFSGHRILWQLFSLNTWKTQVHHFLNSIVSVEKSDVNLIE